MKIIVFDVPAESGGVLTILKEVHNEAMKTKDIEWLFIVGKADLQECEHVKVKKYDWVKKSWIHRIYFDCFVAPHIARHSKADVLFSLENVGIQRIKIPQVLYVHQALLFDQHRYKFKENKVYWFYQNILSKSSFRAMRKSTTIVQTKWMKDAAIQCAAVSENQIYVIPPQISTGKAMAYHDSVEARHTFFYPVNYMPYKHHDTIIEAVQSIVDEDIKNFRVLFTAESSELENATQKLREQIVLTGIMPHTQVLDTYANSILIFASELESFGLPILEARLAGGIILAADTPFAREILEGYENAYIFKIGESSELAGLMKRCMTNEIKYNTEIKKVPPISVHGWKAVVDVLREKAK